MVTSVEKFINSSDLSIFYEIEQVLSDLTVPHLGVGRHGIAIEMTCHMLCEALSRIYELKLESGHFMTNYEHSWLVTKNRNIIDAYPWWIVGGPIMVMESVVLRTFYQPDDLETLDDRSNNCFKESVDKIEKELRAIIDSYQSPLFPSGAAV